MNVHQITKKIKPSFINKEFLYLFVFTIALIGFSIKIKASNGIFTFPSAEMIPVICKDDTIPGDTIAIYTSGLDTTYIIYAEEIADSLTEGMWVINDPNPKIIVELGHQSAAVNEGIIGINLTDIFEPNKAQYTSNANYLIVPDPWEAIEALNPKTVRIFSGASAKFMHPLGSLYDPVNNYYYGGYGYNWQEMVSYFDMTDGIQNGPEVIPGGAVDYDLGAILTALIADCATGCSWVTSGHRDRFVEFYEKCIDQPTYDADDLTTPEVQPLYINEFLDLHHKIPNAEVIYCVNIESQTATEVLAVIDYLREYNVVVAGIELGNEVMGRFGNDALGFEDFEHYWQYINGDPYTDTDEQTELEEALADDVETDHDFIEADSPNVTCPGSFSTASPGGVCVELPAMSMGYIVVPIDIIPLRVGNPYDMFSVYPNPASTHFIVEQKNMENDDIQKMSIEIFNINGNKVHSKEYVTEGQTIDISNFPVGLYNVVIRTDGAQTESETIIKMK